MQQALSNVNLSLPILSTTQLKKHTDQYLNPKYTLTLYGYI